jgi:capsid portal protein
MRNCKQCNSVITNKRNKEHCSKACANKTIAQKRNQTGKKNPHWKGGRKLSTQGYVMILTPEGYQYEHRLIVEEILGRKLEEWEEVHHEDENKQNNDPSNLVVKTKSEHLSDHAKEWVKNRQRDEKGRLI